MNKKEVIYMAKKKKDTVKSDMTFLDAIQSKRRDWGPLNPVTRVIPDKTKYSRKEKHKKDYKEEQ
jgi:hypothetical protein